MSNKKIEDYLHLYIGAMCSFYDITMSIKERQHDWNTSLTINHFTLQQLQKGNLINLKLALRPLSNMAEKEIFELFKIKEHLIDCKLSRASIEGNFAQLEYLDKGDIKMNWTHLTQLNADQFLYLLKQGFDLFGLIEDGLAIDKTKLPK